MCSLKDVGQARLYYCPHELSLPLDSEPVRCIWLPLYHEAQLLLRKFVRVAAHYPWVTNVQSLDPLLDDAYQTLQQRRQIKPGPLLLLVSIFACALNSFTDQDLDADFPYLTVALAAEQTNFWVTAALDALRIAQDHIDLPIQAVQGLILMAFLLIKLEGMNRRCRNLFYTCFWMIRDLGLHRIDHPDNLQNADTIEAEIARRVFWYVCASDWQASARFEGNNECCYFFHPRQIITRRPKHVDDENMLLEQPMSVPTTMSYPLHRIKISEICRNFVDRRPLSLANLSGVTSEDLIDVDTEFQSLLNEVQPFFSMSQEELIAKFHLRNEKAADIVQQGHTLRFLLHSQRCKIHLPYLTKGYASSEFKFSRMRCVESARLVIHSQSYLLEAGSLNGTLFPFAGLLLGVFMASIVLFVDLCMNKATGHEDLHRNEVCQALRLLESARHESETIARFVDSLTEILRKHKITPRKNAQHLAQLGSDGHEGVQPTTMTEMSANLMTPDSGSLTSQCNEGMAVAAMNTTSDEDLSSYFQDLAQSFGQGVGVDQYDWDNILSDLNTSFV